MRSTLTWVAVAVVAIGGVFVWQRSEIVRLRAQVSQQGDALAASQKRLENLSLYLAGTDEVGMKSAASARPRHSDSYSAALRANERRVILDQYHDVIAQMNLPEETASRLQNLLVERIETVLDAEDAAAREGFAEGSSETARAVAVAIADVDRDIVSLVGSDWNRRLDGLLPIAPYEPGFVPGPAPPPVVVNVVAQAPEQPVYSESVEQDVPSDANAYYAYSAPYLYYPTTEFLYEPRGGRSFVGQRVEAGRTHREYSGSKARR